MLFTNTGRTPAKSIAANANYVVFDGEAVPDDFQYPDRQEAPPGYGILGPGVLMPFPMERIASSVRD
jgi:hypothetical protein